jgi:hypothetical protein
MQSSWKESCSNKQLSSQMIEFVRGVKWLVVRGVFWVGVAEVMVVYGTRSGGRG